MLPLLLGVALAAPDRVVTHARLWDGSGGPVVEDAWIVVEDGLFTEVGRGPLPDRLAGVPALDVGGRSLIPGLIDVHTHPWAVPGADLRHDPAEARMAARQRGLRAYLACGVTTVLDTGASWEAVETLRGWLAAGLPGPRYETLGPVVGPPGGYVEAFLPEHPGIGDRDAAVAHLDRLVAAGARGLKLSIEPGYFLPVLPLHTDALQEAIVDEAHARGLPVMVHAQHRTAQERALDLGVDAVLHMVRDRPGDLPARYAESATPLVSTLNLEAAPLLFADPGPLDRPLARLVVPDDQRETATSRAGWRAFRQGMAAVSLPRSAPGLQHAAGALVPAQDYLRVSRRRVLANARALHAAGATLVLGSDSGAYDTFAASFHGLSTLFELGLLVEAGLTPEEALLAGTRDAAALLGLSGEVGVVAPGATADLVVLDADPLADPAALWTVRWTMRAGEVRTPAGWLAGP